MARYEIEVDDTAFEAGFPAGVEEWRLASEEFVTLAADKVVEIARGLAPKHTGRLAESIHHDPLIRVPGGAYLEVIAGGPGIREAPFMEFGSAHAPAEPFMRPALAMVAGAVRGAGMTARLSYSNQARLFRRRAIARAKVRQQQQRGALTLSPAEARATGRFISQRFRYRGTRRNG